MNMATLGDWLEQFRTRSHRAVPTPSRQDDYLLSTTDRDDLGPSIAIFALGESSDGKSLIRLGRFWGKQRGIGGIEELITLFIAEENRHSQLLKNIMHPNGIPELKSNWSDRVFRKIRQIQGLWLMTIILVTAETVALTFYRALARATSNSWLQETCSIIVADEELHLSYEATLLREIEIEHGPIRRQLGRILHTMIYFPVVAVVWFQHRRVFRRALMSPMEYLASCSQDLCAFHQSMLRPHQYTAPAQQPLATK